MLSDFLKTLDPILSVYFYDWITKRLIRPPLWLGKFKLWTVLFSLGKCVCACVSPSLLPCQGLWDSPEKDASVFCHEGVRKVVFCWVGKGTEYLTIQDTGFHVFLSFQLTTSSKCSAMPGIQTQRPSDWIDLENKFSLSHQSERSLITWICRVGSLSLLNPFT